MRYGAAVALALVLLAGCAGQTHPPIPDAASVTIEAPTYKVGDEWRFTGAGYTSRVWIAEVTGDTIVSLRERPARFETCQGCRYVRDSNLTVLRVIGPDGQAQSDAGSGLRTLDFPLRVGKTWDHNLDMASSGGPTYSYTNHFTVEAFELVTVPAGTFKAFRIRQDQENLTSRRRFTGLTWWSPDVRWFVKTQALRETGLGYGGGGSLDVELMSYSLK
jgi:hypothetical protein